MNLMRTTLCLILLTLLVPSFGYSSQLHGITNSDDSQLVSREDFYSQNLSSLISTNPSDFEIQPEVGSGIGDLCFTAPTEETLRVMEARLKLTLTTELGVEVLSLKIYPTNPEKTEFEVKLTCKTNEPGSPNTVETIVLPIKCHK
jgi:phage baseplate assembly protein W